MGVWTLGPYGLHHDQTSSSLLAGYKKVLPSFTLDDVIGSPYAVVNYTVNPAIGTEDDLVGFRKRLASRGLELMLDFVPNHSAVDATDVASRPGIYVAGGPSCPADTCITRDGHTLYYGADYYQHGWTDTVQRNYWNPDTVRAMTTELAAVAAHADWVRCDMAHDVLNAEVGKTWGPIIGPQGYSAPQEEFWSAAISSAAPQGSTTTRFIAEAYNYGFTSPPEETYLLQTGFAFTYQKDLLDKLKANNLDDVRAFVQSLGASGLGQGVKFTENHDEDRAAASLGGVAQACAGTAAAFTLPGMRLMYFGQELGYRNRLDVHLRRAEAEGTDPTAAACYATLLRIVSDSVFHDGDWAYAPVSASDTSWRLMAWRWSLGSSRRAVVINFSDTQGSGAVQLPDAPNAPSGASTIPVTDLVSNTTYQRTPATLRSSGLFAVLQPWSFQIFEY